MKGEKAVKGGFSRRALLKKVEGVVAVVTFLKVTATKLAIYWGFKKCGGWV